MTRLLEQLVRRKAPEEGQLLVRFETGRQKLEQKRQLAGARSTGQKIQSPGPEPADPVVERSYSTGNDHRPPPVRKFAVHLSPPE